MNQQHEHIFKKFEKVKHDVALWINYQHFHFGL